MRLVVLVVLAVLLCPGVSAKYAEMSTAELRDFWLTLKGTGGTKAPLWLTSKGKGGETNATHHKQQIHSAVSSFVSNSSNSNASKVFGGAQAMFPSTLPIDSSAERKGGTQSIVTESSPSLSAARSVDINQNRFLNEESGCTQCEGGTYLKESTMTSGNMIYTCAK